MFFKDREIAVKVRKTKDANNNTSTKEETNFNDKMATAMEVGKQVTYRVGGVVVAYIVLDTWRQCKINKSKPTTNLYVKN